MVIMSNRELSKLPPAPQAGTLVKCPACPYEHPLVLTKSLGFVRCGGVSYLVAVGGKMTEKNNA